MRDVPGYITKLDFSYKIKDGCGILAKEWYKKTCTDAAKLIPVKTLQYVLPYSKDELQQAMNEDSLLNNLNWDLIWQNIMEGMGNPQAPMLIALFAWHRGEDEERDKIIAKYKAIPVLKQAIRLYINTPD